jgi:hypothetical protein
MSRLIAALVAAVFAFGSIPALAQSSTESPAEKAREARAKAKQERAEKKAQRAAKKAERKAKKAAKKDEPK